MNNQKITGMQSKDARAAMAKSQGEVAKETNISRAYLSQFENGIRKLTDSEIVVLRDYYEDLGFVFQSVKHDQRDSAKAALESAQEKIADADVVSIKTVELSELLLHMGDLMSKGEAEDHWFSGIEELTERKRRGDILLSDFLLSDEFGELPAIGFLDSYEENAHKIICCMAVQYVRSRVIEGDLPMIFLDEFPISEIEGDSRGKFGNAVSSEIQRIIASKKILDDSAFNNVKARKL